MSAYWISPRGELIEVGSNHIDVVIKNPAKFGYRLSDIKKIFAKYNETLHSEGDAREKIITDIIKSGWIRLRQYQNYWSVTINILTNKIKDLLYQWANKIMKGRSSSEKYSDVRIVPLGRGSTITKYDVEDISKDILLKEDDGSLCKLHLEKIENLPDVSLKTFKDFKNEN